VIGRRNRPIVIGLVAAALGLFTVFVLVLGSGPYPAWLAAWSVITFAAYAIDKAQARRGGWRIPEIVLHGLAIAGGALGGLIGFSVLHHKTRHPVFPLVLAVALTVQVAIGIAIGW
jgi:uncharacterized membrane protein YsdA (DUF1294 family)